MTEPKSIGAGSGPEHVYVSALELLGKEVTRHVSTESLETPVSQVSSPGSPPPQPIDRHVLITGGAGYIGCALAGFLLEKGFRVRVIDRYMYGDGAIESLRDNPRFEVVEADIRNSQAVCDALVGIDTVVHLAAIVGDPACALDPGFTLDINLVATKKIAELVKKAGIERFIFASTCSVYGACNEVLNETSAVKPVSLYGDTKLASEKMLFGMANESFKPSIVRFATIYGLSGRTRFDLVVNILTAKAKFDKKITVHGGDQWRPLVHVEDAALAVATVVEAPLEVVQNQVFNVGSNEQNHTINDIGKMVKEHVPDAELVITANDNDPRNYKVDFGKIVKTLGFKPKWTVEMGIKQVIEAINSGKVTNYLDVRYSNAATLQKVGTSSLHYEEN